MPTTCDLKFRGFCFFGLLALLSAGSVHAENWTRFRGENGKGTSDQKGIPTTWSQGDYEWDIELPGVGHSSPIVYEDRLFVTSAVDEGSVRHLFCLNANTGEQLWSTTVGYNRSHKHAKGSWASSTPATDGQRVYVALADEDRYTLAAWNYKGELVWRKNLGPFTSQHGQGVSPIVYDGKVIIANDQMGPSSIVALDAETGETVWSTLRAVRRTSYATPMVYKPESKNPQLLCVSGAMGVTSLDPSTGRMNWMTGEFPLRTVASPVAGQGLIFASCGGGGVGKLLIAVDPEADVSSGEPRVAYERERRLPYVPTPVIHGDHLFLWNDNGVVCCVELKTGKTIWTERVGGGNYSGSMVLIDGKIYIMSEEGECVVIAASPEFKVLGRNELGDPSHATPAVANGRLYLRTFHRLACLKARE